jgi:hypothetical protein
VIFIAVVIGRAYQLVLPAVGVTLILAIVGITSATARAGERAQGAVECGAASSRTHARLWCRALFIVWLMGLVLAISALS